MNRRRKQKAATRIRVIVHEPKGTSLVEAEMGKLMHHDEKELLSLWEGWHWDDNKGRWL